METSEVIGEGDKDVTIIEGDGELQFTAECKTLDQLLRDYGIGPRIDMLSVDVEHGELEVFGDFDFSAWDIRAIVVEANRDTSFALDVLLHWRYGQDRFA